MPILTTRRIYAMPAVVDNVTARHEHTHTYGNAACVPEVFFLPITLNVKRRFSRAPAY